MEAGEDQIQQRVADIKTQLKSDTHSNKPPAKKGQVLRSGSIGTKSGQTTGQNSDKKSSLKKAKSEEFTRVTKHNIARTGYRPQRDAKRVSIADDDEVFIIPNKEEQKLQNGEQESMYNTGTSHMKNRPQKQNKDQNKDKASPTKVEDRQVKATVVVSKVEMKKEVQSVSKARSSSTENTPTKGQTKADKVGTKETKEEASKPKQNKPNSSEFSNIQKSGIPEAKVTPRRQPWDIVDSREEVGSAGSDKRQPKVGGHTQPGYTKVDKPTPKEVVLKEMKTTHPSPRNEAGVPKPRLNKVLRYSSQNETDEPADPDRKVGNNWYKDYASLTKSASEQSLSDREDGRPRVEDTLSDYQAPKRYVKQEQASSQESKAPGHYITHDAGTGAGGDNTCFACSKRAYEMEKLITDKAVYHKTCFKCSHCRRILSLTNFASLEGNLYCKPHFLELFKTKGNYDEGFGRERHTKVFAQEQPQQRKKDAPAPVDRKPEEREEEQEEEPWEEIEVLPSISNLKSRFEQEPQKKAVNGPVRTQQATKPSSKQEKARAPSPEIPVEDEVEEEPETELPPVDYTRSMVARFSQMENSTEPEVSRKATRKMTPPREELQKQVAQQFRWTVKEVQPFNRGAGPDHDYKESKQLLDSSEQEIVDNQQEQSQDISYDTYDTQDSAASERESDLPAPATTRTLLARFQSLEDVNKPPPTPEQSSRLQREAVVSTKATAQYSVKQQPEPEHNGYESEEEEVEVEGGEWENTPTHNPDLVRESDYNEVLPQQGTTRNLLAKFQALQGN